jgi:hypothetical protein
MRNWVAGEPISIAVTHFRQGRYGLVEDFASLPIDIGKQVAVTV